MWKGVWVVCRVKEAALLLAEAEADSEEKHEDIPFMNIISPSN
jgi:hypothetical protein